VVGHSDSGYGTIFHSTNGGDIWTRQGSPATIPDTMLQAVAAIDLLTCWVVGESACGEGGREKFTLDLGLQKVTPSA